VKSILVVFLVIASANVSAADSFEQRAEVAKKLEDTDQGQAYEKVLIGATSDYVANAMHQCFPKGVKADADRFVIVADLLADRSLARVEFRPQTKMTQCFVAKFANAPFPDPPSYAGTSGLPIVFDMKIVN
jgi:hypothetical protein